MNILSLFDGMCCGRLALERTGVKIDNFFSSEINKRFFECLQLTTFGYLWLYFTTNLI